MAFGDDLIAASLGGVPFWVDESIDVQAGRRTVVTQLAGSDVVAHEDLGALAVAHDVRAMLIGDDAVGSARALMEVFDRPGPYDYVHRTNGPRQVVLAPGSRPRMTFAEGKRRLIVVSFSLVEVTTKAAIPTAPSSVGKVKVKAAALSAAAAAQWVKKAKKLGKTFDKVVVGINKITSAIRQVKRKALGPLAIADKLDDAIDDLEDAASELAGVPADLASGLNALMAELFQAMILFSGTDEEFDGQASTTKLETAMAAAADIAAIEVLEVDPAKSAPRDADIESDQHQLEILVSGLSLAACAEVFAEVAPASVALANYAIEAMEDLAEALLQDEAVDFDLHVAVREARDAVLARVSETSARLPTTRTFEPVAPTPAIIIAWLMNGDPTRAQEIVARNRVRNPALIVDPVEVIEDG